MQKKKAKTLTEFFMDYSNGILKRREFEEKIFIYLTERRSYFGLTKNKNDEWLDYLSWLYPRISKSVDKYQDSGSSFEAYICSITRYAYKEFRRLQFDNYTTEDTCWNDNADEMTVCDIELPYEEEYEAENKRIVNPRQTLILLLKSYYHVSDSLVSKIAPVLGLDERSLDELLARLRNVRHGKEEKIKKLRERIYSQYYRCLTYEKKLANADRDTQWEWQIKSDLENARIRLNKMRRHFKTLKSEATNREVAKVLGVPKGTIDSSMSVMRKKICRLNGAVSGRNVFLPRSARRAAMHTRPGFSYHSAPPPTLRRRALENNR
ncbi:hypothetical protein AGMMS50212_14870 [Spirochaetia bacterium]|nr:hypothetical protein AGMMS50212_14870 [Spirochaetia bacterium]